MNALVRQRLRASSRSSALDFAKRGFDISAQTIFKATQIYWRIRDMKSVQECIGGEAPKIGSMSVICITTNEDGTRNTRWSPAMSFKEL